MRQRMTSIAAVALVLVAACLPLPALGHTQQDVDWFARIRTMQPATLFIRDGEDIDTRAHDGTGQTAVMWASLQGKAELVKKLIKMGADLTIGEKDGYTPMHGAGFQGRAEVAEVLLANKVDPNDVHRDGYSPIFRAAWGRTEGHFQTMKTLVEGGADIHLKSPSGTLLDVIMENRDHKMMHRMFNYIVSKGHKCEELSRRDHKAKCMALLSNHGLNDHQEL